MLVAPTSMSGLKGPNILITGTLVCSKHVLAHQQMCIALSVYVCLDRNTKFTVSDITRFVVIHEVIWRDREAAIFNLFTKQPTDRVSEFNLIFLSCMNDEQQMLRSPRIQTFSFLQSAQV